MEAAAGLGYTRMNKDASSPLESPSNKCGCNIPAGWVLFDGTVSPLQPGNAFNIPVCIPALPTAN